MSASWRRTGHGLYLPACLDADSLEQRLVEIGTALPSESGITGWAALAWLRTRWADGTGADGRDLPVPILVPNHRTRDRPGVLISAEKIRPGEIRAVDGLPITSPLRSVCFEARHARSLTDAVRWLDIALAADHVSPQELAAYQKTLTAWTGVPRLREAIALADENSWSPMETEMRLQWVLGLGITTAVTNRPVFDASGSFVGTPDLIDLEAGVAGEYDGSLHLPGVQRAKDIRREGLFRRVGLEYVTMTAADRRDPADFLQRTLDAQARARHLTRRWTVDPPAWWVPTTTVAARRALTTAQRERYVRRQAG
jgi:hypothetical protein